MRKIDVGTRLIWREEGRESPSRYGSNYTTSLSQVDADAALGASKSKTSHPSIPQPGRDRAKREVNIGAGPNLLHEDREVRDNAPDDYDKTWKHRAQFGKGGAGLCE